MVRCRACGDMFCCKAHRETHELKTHPSSLHLLNNLPGVCLRCGISVYYLNQLKCKCINRMDKHKVVRQNANVRSKQNVCDAFIRFSSNSTNSRKRKESDRKRIDGTTDNGSRKIIAASRKRIALKDLNFARSNSAPAQTIQFMNYLKEMVSPEIQNALKSSTPISENDGEKKKDFERVPVVFPFDKSAYGTPSEDKVSFNQNLDPHKTRTDLRSAFEENDKVGEGKSTPIRSILSSTFKRSYSEHAIGCNSFTNRSETPLRNLRPSSAKKSVKFSDLFEFKENEIPKTSPGTRDCMANENINFNAAKESENENVPKETNFSALLVTTREQHDGKLSSHLSVIQISTSELSFSETNAPISQCSSAEIFKTSIELFSQSPPINKPGNISNRGVLSEVSQHQSNNSNDGSKCESPSEPAKHYYASLFDSSLVVKQSSSQETYGMEECLSNSVINEKSFQHSYEKKHCVSSTLALVNESYQESDEKKYGVGSTLALVSESFQDSCEKKHCVSSTLALVNESFQESDEKKDGAGSTLALVSESFQESREKKDGVSSTLQLVNESLQESYEKNDSLSFTLALVNESLQESCDTKDGVSSIMALDDESLQKSYEKNDGVSSTLTLVNRSLLGSFEREDTFSNLALINESKYSGQLRPSLYKCSIVTRKSECDTTENIVEKTIVESRGLFSNEIFIGNSRVKNIKHFCDMKTIIHSCDTNNTNHFRDTKTMDHSHDMKNMNHSRDMKTMDHSRNMKNMNHSRDMKNTNHSCDINDKKCSCNTGSVNSSQNAITSITSHSISFERDEILCDFQASDEIKSSFATKITKSLGYLLFGIPSTVISAFGWKKKNDEKKKNLKRPASSSRESVYGSKILVLSEDSDSSSDVGASRNRVRRILRRNPINPSEFRYGSRLSALLLARSPLPNYVERYSEISGQ